MSDQADPPGVFLAVDFLTVEATRRSGFSTADGPLAALRRGLGRFHRLRRVRDSSREQPPAALAANLRGIRIIAPKEPEALFDPGSFFVWLLALSVCLLIWAAVALAVLLLVS